MGFALAGLLYYGPDLWFENSHFKPGQCLAYKNWGVSPKQIVGTKVKHNELFYLLKDDDKYEHMQYISRKVIDHKASRVPCSH